MEEMRQSCPSCDSSEIRTIRHVFHDWDELSEPMYLAICRKCGLGFFNKVLSDHQINALYDTHYFEGDWCWYAKPYKEVWPLRKQNFETTQLSWIMAHKKNGKVIDIGCGGGAIVKAFDEAGYDAVGVELNEDLAKFGITELGIRIIRMDVTKEEFLSSFGKFDIIYMSGLIEHINYPKSLLKSVQKILKDCGLVIIDVPLELNRFSKKLIQAYATLRNKCVKFQRRPYHLIFFKPDSLVALCRNAGYKIKELRTWKEKVLTEEDIRKASFKWRIVHRLDHYFPKVFTKTFDDRAFVVLSR